MKKIKLIIAFFSIFLFVNSAFALDKEQKIYDYANLLTSEEQEALKEKSEEFTNKYNMDIIMVTVKYHDKLNTKEYAQDFYDYNDFGVGATKDGLILVIDLMNNNRYFQITTAGNAIVMYDDARIDSILDSIEFEINKDTNAYFKFFNVFIEESSKFMEKGIPSSNNNLRIDENGDPYIVNSFPWQVVIIVSLIVPTVFLLIFIFKNKMVKKAKYAGEYIKNGSVIINLRNDKFITTHTTSYRINSSNGSSGGSSTSRGSSGISHGGGGRSM